MEKQQIQTGGEGKNPSAEKLRDGSHAKQASLRAQSWLVDNMAYQIRTFSNAIIGFSDLLLAEDLAEFQKEYVNEIYQAGRGLSVLVNDVLDLAKLDAGKLIVSHGSCELADLLGNLYRSIAPAAVQKGLAFHILAEPDVPARMITDEERLFKCLIYICCNAVKFTHTGYIRIHVLLDHHNQPCVRFDIEDTGVGIPAEQLATIFEDVVETEDANLGILSSLDMGLSVTGSLPVTNRLVGALGGCMEVVSRVGVGSTFSLILPAIVNPAEELPLNLEGFEWNQDKQEQSRDKVPSSQASVVSDSRAKTSHCGRVLLVEDQESNRMVISLLLETMGLEVVTAENGQQAVLKASDESFDVILMDLKLPVVDGYQAMRTLRQNKNQTPIVALSAGVMSEQDSQHITNDFNGYLIKPVDREKLYQTLRQFIPGLELKAGAHSGKSPTNEKGDGAYSFEVEFGR